MLSALKRREVRYPICPVDFLEEDLLTVSSSLSSLLLPTLPSAALSDGKFSADLVVELAPLLTSASSAMSLTLMNFWLIWLWLFWALRWVVRLTYLSLKWNVDRSSQNCLNSLVFHSFPSFAALKIDTLEGPVAQILLFSTRNCYDGWAILSFPISSFLLFVIEFFDDLIGLALDLGVVVRLFYWVNLSNNQALPPTISLFSAMSANNGKLLMFWLGTFWA